MHWLDYIPECYDILMCMQKCQDSTSGTCILDCGLEKISNNQKFQNLMHCMVDHNCVPPVVSKQQKIVESHCCVSYGDRDFVTDQILVETKLIFSSQKMEYALLMTRML